MWLLDVSNTVKSNILSGKIVHQTDRKIARKWLKKISRWEKSCWCLKKNRRISLENLNRQVGETVVKLNKSLQDFSFPLLLSSLLSYSCLSFHHFHSVLLRILWQTRILVYCKNCHFTMTSEICHRDKRSMIEVWIRGVGGRGANVKCQGQHVVKTTKQTVLSEKRKNSKSKSIYFDQNLMEIEGKSLAVKFPSAFHNKSKFCLNFSNKFSFFL